jgi:flagellar biosynthetic protein FliO
LPKNKPNNRRALVIMAVMAAVALVGVTMIKVEPVHADRTLTSGATLAGTVNDASASAGETNPSEPVVGAEQPGIGAAVIKMISALALVIAAVYGGLYLLRRMMGRRHGGPLGLNALEVLQTTYVGQHKAISLVKVGKRSVLVGVTDNQISTLTELDQDETEEILGQTPEPVRSENFSRLLTGAAERLKSFGLKKKQAALETQMPATF